MLNNSQGEEGREPASGALDTSEFAENAARLAAEEDEYLIDTAHSLQKILQQLGENYDVSPSLMAVLTMMAAANMAQRCDPELRKKLAEMGAFANKDGWAGAAHN